LVKFLIRHATREDVQAIRTLIHTVQINPTGLSWRRFLVAVSPEDTLMGCGQIKPHADGSREMASIAVQERVRGQGLARAIIDALLKVDLERPLYLMCRARLESFYNKFGFHAIVLDDMPTYFRKIKSLENIFYGKAPPQSRLLVMKLD
jgi:N-acetylglutamate synthase-like GNAT family acetyltransferase